MRPAGVKAFEARQVERSGIYSFEQQNIQFERAQGRQFRSNKAAWKFFQSQPLSCRRAATWWVVNAKREETKAKRLATLIENSEQGRRISQFTPQPKG